MPDVPDIPQRGRLVVATPTLADPNFAHAVVLLLDHGDQGALGVILNRPSSVDIATIMPEWARLAAPPDLLFVGGPVQAGEALIGLARGGRDDSGVAVQLILPGLVAVELSATPDPAQFLAARVFTGYAGWGAGQLEAEIAGGGWFVLDGHAEDVFADDPENLWRTVLARKGGIFTAVPDDPSLN
jgi:putative transcriptional regulator